MNIPELKQPDTGQFEERVREIHYFLIDKAGIVRYKQIGPLTPEALKEKILPLVRELQR